MTFADIATLLVPLARPLPGAIPPQLNDQLSHRHLDLVIAGLRAVNGQPPSLSGPRVEHADLPAFRT